MGWDSKFAEAIAAVDADPMFGIVFRHAPPPELQFIDELKKSHPSLDSDYIRFLSMTDGAGIWWYVFAGSGNSGLPSLEALMRRWEPNIEQLRVFPIGEDPGGNCIAIAKSGRIVQFDYRAESEADCIELALSFREFLDEVLMGPRFYSLFDIPEDEIKEDEWIEFLRQKGWLAASK